MLRAHKLVLMKPGTPASWVPLLFSCGSVFFGLPNISSLRSFSEVVASRAGSCSRLRALSIYFKIVKAWCKAWCDDMVRPHTREHCEAHFGVPGHVHPTPRTPWLDINRSGIKKLSAQMSRFLRARYAYTTTIRVHIYWCGLVGLYSGLKIMVQVRVTLLPAGDRS